VAYQSSGAAVLGSAPLYLFGCPVKASFMADRDRSPSEGKDTRGYIHPQAVKGFAFVVITICIVISMVACILAIWQFAQPDVLWRTVATCFVVAAAIAIFAVVNRVFGDKG
jgi:hypothetical protein